MMKKRMLFIAMVAVMLFVPRVMAAEITAGTDEELKNAFATAGDGDTIKLTDNITHAGGSSSLMVQGGKTITLNLNGKTLTVDPSNESNRSIVVNGGTLNVIGEGTITSEKSSAINVWGVETDTGSDYSVLNVGEDVTLTGKIGIGVFYDVNNAYGVKVNFAGTIKVKDNGITINGIVQHENAPVINIEETAVIEATGEEGVGIYAAGNGTWNIKDGAQITGATALGIKAGVFNIEGGTFTGTGAYVDNPELYGNGINPSGSAIQIETNDEYYGEVQLNISGGTFISENGNAIAEYGSDNNTAVDSIKIEDGEFISAEGKDAIAVSEGLSKAQENNDIVSIEGGVFIGEVDESLVSEDAIKVSFAAVVDGEVYNMDEVVGTIVVTKGYKFDKEDKEALEELIGEEFDGYVFEGFYTSEDLKTKLDLDKALNEDTTIYMNYVKSTKKEVEPPKTGDMNLLLVLGAILLGGTGLIAIRKKLAKNN